MRPRQPGQGQPPSGRIPAKELSALLTVSSALASSLDLPVVLQTAIESAVQVLRLDTGAIYTLANEQLYLGATTPPLPPGFPEEYRLAQVADHPHINGALTTGDSIYLRDAADADLSPAEQGVVEARGLRSILYVPLLLENEPIGVLIVGTTGDLRDFDDADMDLCRTLSAEITLAAANAQLYESLRSSCDELQSVNAHLEQLVDARTEELAAANEELRTHAEELQGQAAALEERTQELSDANEAKAFFLRSMSHELRTPLNSIIGFSQILQRGLAGDVTEEQRRQLDMISRSGSHLLALINDILDLSRIEAHALQLSFARVDVADLVRESVDAVTLSAEAKGLRLASEVPDPAPDLVSDVVKVRQILLNLLGNAVKFTTEGSVTVTVSQPARAIVEFRVTDTGSGIAPEHVQTVFGDFDRLPVQSDIAEEGTGLGLGISRRLASALGGSLTLESEVGKGSTFTLTLPQTHLDLGA